MSTYRRVLIPGATYFSTVALADRSSDLLTLEGGGTFEGGLCDDAEGAAVLVQRVCCVVGSSASGLDIAAGDADYSTRWGAIEARFTRRAKASGVVGWNPTLRTVSKTANGDAGIWQRRFWEHTIRDERDYRNHMAYCWGNPVKYGLVERLTDWTYSSIHRDIRAGRVDTEWSGVITDGAFGEP